VSAVSSPSGIWAKPQPTNDLVHLESKSAALVAAVFVDFSKNKCNFLHKKQARYRTVDPIPHRAAPYEEFFSRAVATIAFGSRRL